MVLQPNNMGIDRPLDLLNSLKNKTVIVERKGKDSLPVIGILLAFDIHINLVIETDSVPIFIRGDIVETVMSNK